MAKKSGHIKGLGSRLDAVQATCDVIGMTEVPIVSQGADVVSGLISLATGDYVGAVLSVGGLIPGIGQATGAMKIARNTAKVADAANNLKSSERLLELTMATKKVDVKDLPKNATTKKSYIEAKQPTKKEKFEKENTDMDDFIQEPVVGGNFDISDGVTNSLAGKGLNIKVDYPVQSSNYNSWMQSVETGKPFYNTVNVLGKNNIFGL